MRLRFTELLKLLRANDVQITLSGDGMAYDAPQGVITADIAAEMKRHKADLISYLKLKPSLDEAQMRNKIILGASEVVLSSIPDNSIDCIVTDPPYGYGFMCNGWDHSVPRTDIWNECLRVLKPGAFAFIMSAPRQDVLGRQIFCIEEAGFCVDFTPIYWAYASGFPKLANVSKAIDKKAGAVRKIIKRNPNSRENCGISNTIYESGTVGKTAYITLPATEKAKELDGSYAGFQPKPAVEVIIVAMKPLKEKTFTEQAESNGKGVTWLDDCRIPYADETMPTTKDRTCGLATKNTAPGSKHGLGRQENGKGRLPANLLVSDEILDEHSKFFDIDKWANEHLPFIWVPKASRKEKEAGLQEIKDQIAKEDGRLKDNGLSSKLSSEPRKNPHPTVKPLKLMSYLITMGSRPGDIVLDPFSGTGTTSIAAMLLKRDYIGIEISPEYHEIALKRLDHFRRKKAA
jgi:site-specific DNA-methyltransferase (adenine-specific)